MSDRRVVGGARRGAFLSYGRVPLGCIGACPPPRPTRRRGSAQVSVSGTRTPAPAEGSGGNGAPWPAATRPEGVANKTEEKAFSSTSTPTRRSSLSCTFACYSQFSGHAAMRGRLYATALAAIFLALLLATASAQENHQDTAGVPEGFDADAQAARDAEAYLTPEEKSVIQIGNDLLRGNATIPEREDYDVDTVRTRALVSLASYAHVPSAPDYVSEHVALARHDTWHQLPGCQFSVTAAARRVRVLRRTELTFSSPDYRTRASHTGERIGERRGGRRVAPLPPGVALGARAVRRAGAVSPGGGVLRAEETAGRARD